MFDLDDPTAKEGTGTVKRLQIIFCVYFLVGEVVKQVNHIIRSKIGGVRSEYLATKEKKLEKRRSFKY